MVADRNEIDDFKGLLREYVSYRSRMRELGEKMSLLWYELSGVKGLRYDRIPVTGKTEGYPEWKEKISGQIEDIRKEIMRIQLNRQKVKAVLNAMNPETAYAVVEIYGKGRTYASVALEIHISVGGLQKRISKELRIHAKEYSYPFSKP